MTFGIRVIWCAMLISGFSSCSRLTIEVEEIPIDTPKGASVFISGNFNFWDAGDGSFRMNRGKNGKYYIDIPFGWGTVEYKFTRGDWTAVEADGCGNQVQKRTEISGFNHKNLFGSDTIRNKIYSWLDLGPTNCEKITFRIKKLPRETPKNSKIYILGSFNDWKPNDAQYLFKRYGKDNFSYITIQKSEKEIEFKLTRGPWETEEVDINGEKILNRKFVFGKTDTLDLSVSGWMDINPGIEARNVTFLVGTPIGTPPGDPVYIVGNFNKWFPGDPAFRMNKLGSNLFSIQMKKPAGEMEYKFCRGAWGTEEMDVFGNHISNRKLRTSADTVKINIPEWLDIPLDQTFSLNQQETDYVMNNPDVLACPTLEDERAVKFTIKANLSKPTFLYIRISLPSSPNNRNYGFVDLVKPGKEIKVTAPKGATFFACDGPFWNDNRPKEKAVLIVSENLEGTKVEGSLFLPPK